VSRPPRTWLPWLAQQVDRDDEVGSFARSYLPCCSKFTTPHSYRRALFAQGADPDAPDFLLAREEFFKWRDARKKQS
jgi:hypothetical protein